MTVRSPSPRNSPSTGRSLIMRLRGWSWDLLAAPAACVLAGCETIAMRAIAPPEMRKVARVPTRLLVLLVMVWTIGLPAGVGPNLRGLWKQKAPVRVGSARLTGPTLAKPDPASGPRRPHRLVRSGRQVFILETGVRIPVGSLSASPAWRHARAGARRRRIGGRA